MSATKAPYEAPAIHSAANLVAVTKNHLVTAVESDLTGRDPFGTVGFGV